MNQDPATHGVRVLAGVSPLQYLQTRHLPTACHLLEETTLLWLLTS